MLRFFVFLLFIAVAGGAFYGGMRYQKSLAVENAAMSQPTPDDHAATFEKKRVAVDAGGQKWLADNLPIQLSKEGIAKVTESKDSEFLYLYGRALMLAGNHREAMQAFDLALANLRPESKAKLTLDQELKLAGAAAALKSKPKAGSQEAAMAEQKAVRTLDELLGLKSEAVPK